MNIHLGGALLIVFLMALITIGIYMAIWALSMDSRRQKIVSKYLQEKPEFKFYGNTNWPLEIIRNRVEAGKIKTEGISEKKRKQTEQELLIYGALREFPEFYQTDLYIQQFIQIPDDQYKQYIFEIRIQPSASLKPLIQRIMRAEFISEEASLPEFKLVPENDPEFEDVPNQVTLDDATEFPGMYHIQTKEKNAVHRFFTPALQEFLVNNPHFKITATGHHRISIETSESEWYRDGLLKEKYIVSYLEAVEELFSLLRQSAGQ